MIAAVAVGFSWCQYKAHAVFGPVLSERFYGAVQVRVTGIDRSLSDGPRLTLDELVLETLPRQITPRRIGVALHGMVQEHIPQIGDTLCYWRRIYRRRLGLRSRMAMIFKDRLGLRNWALWATRGAPL